MCQKSAIGIPTQPDDSLDQHQTRFIRYNFFLIMHIYWHSSFFCAIFAVFFRTLTKSRGTSAESRHPVHLLVRTSKSVGVAVSWFHTGIVYVYLEINCKIHGTSSHFKNRRKTFFCHGGAESELESERSGVVISWSGSGVGAERGRN